MNRYVRTPIAAALMMVAALAIAGCSSSSSSSASPSPTSASAEAGSFDCVGAQAALDAYQAAIGQMAMGVESGDDSQAAAGAQALIVASDEVAAALAGAPSIVATFVDTSKAAAQRVADAVDEGKDVADLAQDMQLTFNAPLFQQASPEINRYLAAQCPDFSSASPRQ